jgi:SpoIID/LytB domain protein
MFIDTLYFHSYVDFAILIRKITLRIFALMKTQKLLKITLSSISLFAFILTASQNASAVDQPRRQIEPALETIPFKPNQKGLNPEFDPSYFDQYSTTKRPAGLMAAGDLVRNPGQMVFSGKSPDAVGHGVGMSQWGAFGAAKKGWNAAQILGLYYTNTAIETRSNPTTVEVKFYAVDSSGRTIRDSNGNPVERRSRQTMSIEDYVAGIGEVPSFACGTQDQVNAQNALSADHPLKNKYAIDNPNSIFDCWPEEAIKAQAIAARSYAATYGGAICDNAECQVYVEGSTKKRWAAYETSVSGVGQYVISKGATANNQIIKAFYSSNNNNGIAGTADNDTVWSDKAGNGTKYSYLRSANDNAVNYDVSVNRSSWTTNSYSIDTMNGILQWCVQNCASGPWVKANITDRIGNQLKSMALEKDASGRVKKVYFYGTNGVMETMSGWYFASMFNFWSDSNTLYPQKDYIRSISFSFELVPDDRDNHDIIVRYPSRRKNGSTGVNRGAYRPYI